MLPVSAKQAIVSQEKNVLHHQGNPVSVTQAVFAKGAAAAAPTRVREPAAETNVVLEYAKRAMYAYLWEAIALWIPTQEIWRNRGSTAKVMIP